MEEFSIEQRYRRFLLAVAGFIFIGTILELILLEHFQETLQFTPFILSGVGLLAVIAVWVAPNRLSLLTLRWVMAAVALGSLFGMYQHFSGNLAFVMEINPTFTTTEALLPAIKGSFPLLAPGILLVAGILGIAATYQHPELER
ncbi:MAG TPA: hypothetical protein VFG39_03835 [Balneolaceae bacterium]|nr:hypothetical protein [Balneolaceae bacterium]